MHWVLHSLLETPVRVSQFRSLGRGWIFIMLRRMPYKHFKVPLQPALQLALQPALQLALQLALQPALQPLQPFGGVGHHSGRVRSNAAAGSAAACVLIAWPCCQRSTA